MASGSLQRLVHIIRESEGTMVPALILRVSFLAITGAAMLVFAARAARAAYLELYKFVVLFRCSAKFFSRATHMGHRAGMARMHAYASPAKIRGLAERN